MTKRKPPSNVIPLRRRHPWAPNYDARVSDLFARLIEDEVWQDLLDLTIGDLLADWLIGGRGLNRLRPQPVRWDGAAGASRAQGMENSSNADIHRRES
jgi:hypothetical protein